MARNGNYSPPPPAQLWRSRACQSSTGGYGHARCQTCDCPCHVARMFVPARPFPPLERYITGEAGQVEEARNRGEEAGRAAGSWVIDGNTSTETARKILQGLEDGNPETMDMMPAPLSGEWAGESIMELLGDFAYPINPDYPDEGSDVPLEVCDAYEQGFMESYWAEVERAATYILGHDVFGHPVGDSEAGHASYLSAVILLALAVIMVAALGGMVGEYVDAIGNVGAGVEWGGK